MNIYSTLTSSGDFLPTYMKLKLLRSAELQFLEERKYWLNTLPNLYIQIDRKYGEEYLGDLCQKSQK